MKKIFSGGASIARVHPAGIALMVAGVAAVALADGIARRVNRARVSPNTVKLAGMAVCAGGALLAILG